jgi:hypothetical protein
MARGAYAILGAGKPRRKSNETSEPEQHRNGVDAEEGKFVRQGREEFDAQSEVWYGDEEGPEAIEEHEVGLVKVSRCRIYSVTTHTKDDETEDELNTAET